jgi:quercetin dioxygenase-like cupin family protein
MAFRGQVLINPVSGERFVFHTTADESRGELLEFDTVIEPHGRVPGGHVHPGQQESFEVRAGVMRFRKGLRTVTAGPGDLVVVEPGTYHRFANAGDEPAIVRVRVTPALRMEELFETVAALAAEGRTLPSGMPRPLDLALFMREFEHEVAAPVAPALARTVMAPLAAIGERRGLAARYPAVPLSARPVPIRPGAGRASATRPSPARPAPSRPGGPGASAPRRTAGRRG